MSGAGLFTDDTKGNARLAGRALKANGKKVVTQNMSVAPVKIKDKPIPAKDWLAHMMGRAKRTGCFSEHVTITPAIAEVLLAANPNNRNIVASAVAHWSQALRSGDWETNGESIIVAATGELNDGQHRLTAVVQTGIPMPTFVVFGVSRDSRKTVDMGSKRSAGHVLGMSGVVNAALVAATAKVHLNLRFGVSIGLHRSSKEIERETETYRDLLVYRHESVLAAKTFRQSVGMMCALHCIMARKHGDKPDVFFDLVARGIGISDKRNAAFVLRKRLLDNLANKAKLPGTEIAAITIKAWNAYIEDKPLGLLRWNADGENGEPFPKVR